MELHEKKFESLSYRLPANIKRGEQLPFQNDLTTYTTPSGIEIKRKGLVRDLGVSLTDNFTWTPHINKMVASARKVASWVLGVFRDRSKVVMLQLYKSLRGRLQRTSAKISDFQTTRPSPCPGVSEFPKPPPSPDVRVRIFQFLHIFIKSCKAQISTNGH